MYMKTKIRNFIIYIKYIHVLSSMDLAISLYRVTLHIFLVFTCKVQM